MTSDEHLVATLREANPIDEATLEPTRPEAAADLLARADAEPHGISRPRRRAPRPAAPPGGRRPRALVLAGAAVVLVLVAAGAGAIGLGPADPVAEARAALRDTGVYHVRTTITRTPAGRDDRPLVVETWSATDRPRTRTLTFVPSAFGDRPVSESVGDDDGSDVYETRDVRYEEVPGAIPVGAPEGAAQPRQAVLDLLATGRVAERRRITLDGRPAWRIVVSARSDGFVADVDRPQEDPPRVEVPPHERRSILVLDAESHLPLRLSTSGLVADGTPRRPVVRRETNTMRFSRFERLTGRAAEAGLRPSARFGGG